MAISTDAVLLRARWKPIWAVVLAWLLLVPASALALYGIYSTSEGVISLIQGPSFAELGIEIGVPSLLAGLLVGIPLVLFVRRGGKVALAVGIGGLVLCVAIFVAAIAILSEMLPLVGYR
jgi:hypothetical protein